MIIKTYIKKIIIFYICAIYFYNCKPMINVDVQDKIENANFIIHWKPKSAFFSLNKSVPLDSNSNHFVPVDYRYDGKIVNQNLLNNPLYLKLEIGSTYSFTIFKDGFSEVSEEVSLKIGETFNKKYELSNGIEKAKIPEGWSTFRGIKNWEEADKECFNLDMRLPTSEELKIAIQEGIKKTWEVDSFDYWSNDIYDSENNLKILSNPSSSTIIPPVYYGLHREYKGTRCRK